MARAPPPLPRSIAHDIIGEWRLREICTVHIFGRPLSIRESFDLEEARSAYPPRLPIAQRAAYAAYILGTPGVERIRRSVSG